MPSQAKSGLRLEIGHALFIDIVGYSALLLNGQSSLLAELNEAVIRLGNISEGSLTEGFWVDKLQRPRL
jgi:hypothetical protein